KLNIKLVLLTTTAFVVVLLAIGSLDIFIIRPAFKQLEQTQALEDSARARAAIDNELQQLGQTLSDWANWDNTYEFAEGRRPGFIQANFSEWPLMEKNTHLNFCLILDRQGRVLYVDGYNKDAGGTIIPADFQGEKPPILSLLQPALKTGQVLSGLLPTEQGLLLFVARPILTSAGTGPSSGVFAFGRFLDAPLLQQLSRQTRVKFELFLEQDRRLSPAEQALWRALESDAPPSVRVEEGFVYEILTDLQDQAVALLRTPVRHEISLTAQITSRMLAGLLGLTTLLLLLGGAYWINRVKHDEKITTTSVAWGTATLMALVGLTLTAGIFLELRRNSQEALEQQFRFVSTERIKTIIEKFRNNLRDLDAVRRFYEGSESVSRTEFRQFVIPVLGYQGFQALEWLPHVTREQRPAFEAAAQQDGFPDFQFTECISGPSATAGDRDEYFPVYYLEPYAGNEAAMGCAPGPDHPARGSALNQARDSGQITLSERYTLVQETAGQFSVLAFAPVYRGTATRLEERLQQLQGFVLGVMRISSVVDSALVDTESRGLILRLLDLSAREDQQLLHVHFPRTGSHQPAAEPLLRHQIDFAFANRIWRIESQPNAAFIANHLDGTYRWVPVTGLLLTLMAALYLFTVISQHQRAEALVATRTRELRASEERFRALHEASFGGISIHDKGVILECNQGLADITRFPVNELIGMNGLLLIAPQWRDQVIQHILSGYESAYEVEGLRKNGEVYPLEIHGKNIPYKGQRVRVTEFRDVSELKRAEERLRLAGAVLEGARESIVVTDPDGHILAANPAFTTLSGYTEAEALGRNPRFLQSDLHTNTYFTALWQTVAREGAWQGEFRGRSKTGSLFTVLATVSQVRDAAEVSHYVVIATDITHIQEAEQRIEHLAYYDPLTNLPNRTLLAQRAELALALATRREEALTLLLIDLDRFKEINDSVGHTEGDALLIQVAERIKTLLRETDTVCRVGGDEFVLLLPDTDQSGALEWANQLMRVFHQPFTVAGHSLQATVSIGIALYPHDGATFDDLLKNADTALYRAKQEGRNHAVFYAREMNVATFERLVLESELRRAIEAGQLRAYFQPKVQLIDGAPIGAEALVRWLHPDHGLVPPGRFIPVAEASDLIVAIGDWMLEAVCRQLAIWQAAGLPPVSVAVNLAARHFRDPNLIQRIQDLLSIHKLTPQALALELTESTLLETGAQTLETLRALQQLGVGLAIDDFGTGYSSLGYLKRLPIDALKIDQSFVRDLVTDADDRILAATIVTLGHSLGLKVVAEGVETEEQRRFLIEKGCDLAQGYLFSPPLPADEFVEWLRHAPSPSVEKAGWPGLKTP
ncbi:MAG: hypothetical protein QG599_1532, partial [Pseudomonadota bacterium]|nr:hypothetical protein [Pseudomonadota bacterium]